MSAMTISYILEITKRDFRERFSGSVLGPLWAIIWPMVYLFIYVVIFGRVIGAKLPGTSQVNNYGIYLAAGLIPWTAFASTITRSASVFIDKKHILTKVNISFFSLFFQIVLSESITYIISMLTFFVVLLFLGHDFHRALMFLPFVYYLQQLLALGLGFITAIFTIFIRDTREITGIILQLWFWFTPIVYVPEILPSVIQKLMVFNPFYSIVQSYQRMFILNMFPSFKNLIILTLLIHIVLFVSFLMLQSLEKEIRDFL